MKFEIRAHADQTMGDGHFHSVKRRTHQSQRFGRAVLCCVISSLTLKTNSKFVTFFYFGETVDRPEASHSERASRRSIIPFLNVAARALFRNDHAHHAKARQRLA